MTAPMDAESLALARAGSTEPAEAGAGPRSFRRKQMWLRVRWHIATRVEWAGRDELAASALLRVQGELCEPGLVLAKAIAILTSVATVVNS